MRDRVGWVVVAMIVLLAGCGSSDDAADEAGTTSTSAAHASEQQIFRVEGSAIADGLTVPAGTRMAGPVFAAPSDVDGHDSWTAYLTVDGDPFAAWDDLAAQLRDGDQPFEIAGSADACTWMVADDAPSSGGGSALPTTDSAAGRGEPTTGAAPIDPAPVTTTTAAPAVDPYLASVTITDAAPGPDIDGVDCSASAPVSVDGATHQMVVYLRLGARWQPTMQVLSQWTDEANTSGPLALRTTLERQSQQGDVPAPVPGPDPVPAAASEHVPSALAQEEPKPGGGFGAEVNCFAGGGYHQLDLPPGATFVAGGFNEASSSVLAVDDLDAALDDLGRQVAGDGTSEDGPAEIRDLTLADGTKITELAYAVSGGGGGCSAVSSPDGRFLVVAVHGD